jgi:hypothetical protein
MMTAIIDNGQWHTNVLCQAWETYLLHLVSAAFNFAHFIKV